MAYTFLALLLASGLFAAMLLFLEFGHHRRHRRCQIHAAFVERFRDYPDVIRAPKGIDVLIYTPEEFARERRCNRFVRQALREGRRLL